MKKPINIKYLTKIEKYVIFVSFIKTLLKPLYTKGY